MRPIRHRHAWNRAGLMLVLALAACAPWPPLAAQDRAEAAAQRVTPRLQRDLAEAGLRLGAAPYLRVFKLEDELELWLATDQGYRLFRRYPICAWSANSAPSCGKAMDRPRKVFIGCGADR
jgi:murein L,D-transpeptidase YafK